MSGLLFGFSVALLVFILVGLFVGWVSFCVDKVASAWLSFVLSLLPIFIASVFLFTWVLLILQEMPNEYL